MAHPPVRIESYEWVKKHLLCEYSHWDICLSGIVVEDGERMACFALDDESEWNDGEDERTCAHIRYEIVTINWDDEKEEWLADYMKAYPWWVYVDGVRKSVTVGCCKHFYERWRGKSPIFGRK